MASYLLSTRSKVTDLEHASQFKPLNDPDSKGVDDLLLNERIPVILFNNLLTFPDTDKKLELEGELLEMITNKNYNVDLAKLSEKKLLFDFATERYFDEKASSNKALGINLWYNYLNHLLSWQVLSKNQNQKGVLRDNYPPISRHFVIERNLYDKRSKLVRILSWLMMKLLL